MKRIASLLLVSGILTGLSTASHAQETVFVRDMGGVHGPPSGSDLSPDYPAFRDNRGAQMLNQIRGTGTAPIGTGPYQVSQIESMTYRKMIVTPNTESWHGAIAPGSRQHGNSWYHGIYVYVTSGTFVPAQVTVRSQTLTWNGSTWVVVEGMGGVATLQTTHSARIRMVAGPDGRMGTQDDVPADTQNGNLDSKGFLFFGISVGFGPYSPGTSQQNLDDTVFWAHSKRIKIRYTITVPATTGTKTFYIEDGPDDSGPDWEEGVTGLRYDSVTGILTWTSNGRVAIVEKSSDLLHWSDYPSVWLPKGETFTLPTTERASGEPRYFYRVRSL